MAAPKYLKNNAGVITELAASETSAAEVIVATLSTGLLDISLMPTGIGADTKIILASEALSAGAFVNIYNNSSTANCRNADCSAASAGKKAHGFVLAAVLSSGNATVYLSGLNTSVTGATVGDVFLSTAGAATSTAPSTSGYFVQNLGVAVSATAIQFDPNGTQLVLA